ncbi:MAG: FAD-dependent oxidoreductase [Deltaproteobacteria bacterium]|nr:FAD-dependent oxidoreductase [Deltaproteobacteria bacterium]
MPPPSARAAVPEDFRVKAKHLDVTSNARQTVILGGGLTGISAAVHLRSPWVLLEKEARLGGHARTDERGGYRFDKTGHWLHLRDPAVKQLVAEILPGQMQSVARKARVFSHGVLTRYPYQANLHGLPPDVIKDCLMGVVEARVAEAQRNAQIARGAAPEPEPTNFEEYCLRHFGAGISKHFMIPYNERIWGVSPREITADWCSRFVPLPNLDQVIGGAVGAGPPELGYNVSFLYPKQGGIETFTRALQTRMADGQVHTATSPDVVDWQRREVVVGGERIPYRALVATIPLPELLRRMPGLPADVEAAAVRLRCTTLRYLNVATRSAPPADWHWIYVPERRYPFYRVGIFTNAMASMAPAGGASLYVELADRAPVTEAGVRDALIGLTEAGAIASPEDVVFAEPKEIEYAYVVFDQHYYAATTAIFRFLEANGIYPRGRYGAWTYNAMEDCVIAGREVAAQIDSFDQDPPRS